MSGSQSRRVGSAALRIEVAAAGGRTDAAGERLCRNSLRTATERRYAGGKLDLPPATQTASASSAVGEWQEQTSRDGSKAVRNPFESRGEPVGFLGSRDNYLLPSFASR